MDSLSQQDIAQRILYQNDFRLLNINVANQKLPTSKSCPMHTEDHNFKRLFCALCKAPHHSSSCLPQTRENSPCDCNTVSLPKLQKNIGHSRLRSSG